MATLSGSGEVGVELVSEGILHQFEASRAVGDGVKVEEGGGYTRLGKIELAYLGGDRISERGGG